MFHKKMPREGCEDAKRPSHNNDRNEAAEQERRLAGGMRRFASTEFNEDTNFWYVLEWPETQRSVIMLEMIRELNCVAVWRQNPRAVVPGEHVVTEISIFIHWLNGPRAENSIAFAAEAHVRLVRIHPFLDGNGRTARLLLNLILRRAGHAQVLMRKGWRDNYNEAMRNNNVGAFAQEITNLVMAQSSGTGY
ncbi:hypothetical protein niasHT_002627 [Heterodera trifolii]|uniref:Fido domain-containing protein n=1 Tax=Heterodera trifolii TaxID=157864 RepID=A0ABD2LU86_9BILA